MCTEVTNLFYELTSFGKTKDDLLFCFLFKSRANKDNMFLLSYNDQMELLTIEASDLELLANVKDEHIDMMKKMVDDLILKLIGGNQNDN